MANLTRIRKVTLKSSIHYGKDESWRPVVKDGKFILAHRFPGTRRNLATNVVRVATLEAAIKLLDTGKYCIRMVGSLTGKDTLIIPGSLVIKR